MEFSESIGYAYITIAASLGLIFGIINIFCLTRVPVGEAGGYHQNDRQYLEGLIGRKTVVSQKKDKATGQVKEVEEDDGPYFESWDEVVFALNRISQAVSSGAKAFLSEEHKILAGFMLVFAVIISLLVDTLGEFWTSFAFLLGATTSIVSGYVGMRVAVFANSRTAYSAVNRENGLANAFIVAFRGGSVLGFVLTSMGLLNLLVLIWVYKSWYSGCLLYTSPSPRDS